MSLGCDGVRAKESKAKQSNAKQSKAGQSKAKQSRAKQSKAQQSKAKQGKEHAHAHLFINFASHGGESCFLSLKHNARRTGHWAGSIKKTAALTL